MIGLIILCCILACVSVFELLQIKMLWGEIQAKYHDNKELGDIVDMHSKWLNNLSDEMRDVTRVMRKLP